MKKKIKKMKKKIKKIKKEIEKLKIPKSNSLDKLPLPFTRCSVTDDDLQTSDKYKQDKNKLRPRRERDDALNIDVVVTPRAHKRTSSTSTSSPKSDRRTKEKAVFDDKEDKAKHRKIEELKNLN